MGQSLWVMAFNSLQESEHQVDRLLMNSPGNTSFSIAQPDAFLIGEQKPPNQSINLCVNALVIANSPVTDCGPGYPQPLLIIYE
jgi:hypothetical protein